jgi:plasmid stabilization system protein ParE
MWTERAFSDLQDIAEYHSGVDKSKVKIILSVASELTRFPFVGKKTPELDDDEIFEQIASYYRIIFKYIESEHTIVILTLLHVN